MMVVPSWAPYVFNLLIAPCKFYVDEVIFSIAKQKFFAYLQYLKFFSMTCYDSGRLRDRCTSVFAGRSR